jgi:hypothetical protein
MARRRRKNLSAVSAGTAPPSPPAFDCGFAKRAQKDLRKCVFLTAENADGRFREGHRARHRGVRWAAGHLIARSAAGGDRVRGKDYNIGLRGGLIDQRHYDRMGSAIWLYAWLILRQTHQHDDTGWVLGGSPVTYREIEEETGFRSRTLERWMRTLRSNGYIETRTVAAGIVVQVTKAKKSTRFPQGVRKSAERLREVADRGTQTGFVRPANQHSNQELTGQISSSSIEESIEKKRKFSTGISTALQKTFLLHHNLARNPVLPRKPNPTNPRHRGNPYPIGEMTGNN